MAEYMLQKEYPFGSSHNRRVLPAGAFVFPIHVKLLPKHVLEKYTQSVLWDEYGIGPITKPEFEYCYTHYGIIPILTAYYRKSA